MIQKNNKLKVVVILGPTASGKTALSLKLALRLRSGRAKKLECEIVSADSRAIYKYMDIGTAKPAKKEMTGIPHHLIDVVSPDNVLSLSQYKELALQAIYDIQRRKRLPFLVGGTALYVYAVIDNWLIPEVPPNKKLRAKLEKQNTEKLWRQLLKKDPASKSFVDSKNKRRVIRALEIIAATGRPFSEQRKKGPKLFDVLVLGVKRPDKEIKKIIEKRTKQMLKAGLVREVRNLLRAGYSPSLPSLSGIHYKEIIDYLNKKITLAEAIALINKNGEQLVRRQMVWFKKDRQIKWIENLTEAQELIRNFLR